MRASPLVLAVAIGLGLSLPANEAANAASKIVDVKSSNIKTYIVTFDELPLARFKGSDGKNPGMPKMAATSPSVTGEAKFNINSAASQNYRRFLASQREQRLELAASMIGRNLKPTFVYDVVLNGFAAAMTEAEAAQLRGMAGVKRVNEEVIMHPLTDRGPAWIKADQVWAGGGTPSIVGKKGDGIIVGVIDTGINRSHPSFSASGTAGATYAETFTIVNPRGTTKYGHCAIAANASKCNNKLIGLWDFITKPTPGYAGPTGTFGDAVDKDGHGTHTASTATGNAVKVTIPGGSSPYTPTMSGVAPHANIIAYKGCGDTGCPSPATTAAIEQAVIDGVNVISFSIGGGPSDPYSLGDNEEAFLAAREAGIVSAVAAGNDGPSPGTVGNPSNAPWVMSVAATTHDRALVRSLVLTGGNVPRPGGGTLYGSGSSSAALTLGPTLLKKDPAYPLCATGTDTDDAATGVSKPPTWTTFYNSSRLVACQRGYYSRVAKSYNVSISSGVGMILYNQLEEGDSLISDNYAVPTIHIGYTDGVALTNWLDTGSGHTGQITGAVWSVNPALGDKLASFSSRGPVIPLGIVKPDLAAPGVNIYAAAVGASCNSNNGANCISSALTIAPNSGTSMATPHVAGAAALVKAVNPTWTPSQIISALVLTARASVTVNGVIGTPHEIGGGQTDVSKAVRAGLYLPVTDTEFKATNAGTANNLNLPSLGNAKCFESCTLPRTFKDMVGGGNYNIVSSLPAGVTMTPSSSSVSFTSGQSQTVNFTFNVVNAPSLLGKWVYGSVTLQNTSGNGRPDLKLPVAIYSSPYSNIDNAVTLISQNVTTERGHFDYTFSGATSLAALPDARFIAGDLAAPKLSTPSLVQDPTLDDPYDTFGAGSGTFNDTFTIPASPVSGPVTYKIHVATSSAESQDADLYVGQDGIGAGAPNSLPDSDEELCVSASNDATELCEFNVTTTSTPQVFWILVQNFKEQTTNSSDTIQIDSYQASIQAGITGNFIATGPGKTASGAAVKTRIAWDDPTFLPGQKRIGYLLVQASAGVDAIQIPVELTRTGGNTFEPFALANNVARSVTLPAGTTHNKLYFDVPPNATSVTFTTTGTGTVTLGTVRLASPTAPVIEAAPVANTFTSNAAGANQTITIAGASLQPGRWYLKPTNAGAATATVAVKAVINTSNVGATFKVGSYYNPSRSGHGLFVYKGGPDWAVIWYTYLQDTTPTWYYMQGPAPGVDGIWKGTIYRAAWNGTTKSQTVIGEAQITVTADNTFDFHYNLDGQQGSETMLPFVTGCPQFNGTNLDVSTHWYNPAQSGFGYTIQVNPTYEFAASFLYDGNGVSRWLVAERGGAYTNATETFGLEQIGGFCPLCAAVTTTRTTVGTYTRTFATADLVSIGTNATFANGVPGTWNLTSNVDPLTFPQGCNP